MPKNYDCVVVGAGVFGAWTAWSLRQSGLSVALLDAYGAANSRASSGGETRIIRMGYGPDAFYTRMALSAMPKWKELAERTGQSLFIKTGVLWLSSAGDHHTQGMVDVLKRENVRCETLSSDDLRRRYSQFAFNDVTLAVLEPDSGVLLARQSVQLLVNECIRAGVDYKIACVVPPERTGRLSSVSTTARDSIAGGTFIFACGPWLPKMFPHALRDRIRSTRQEVFFLGAPPGDDRFSVLQMPAWLYHTHPLRPYALPDVANRGVKLGFDQHGGEFDPDHGSRRVEDASLQRLREFLKEHVPGLQNAPIVETRVCQYENTDNGDLLIDRDPHRDNVWFVGGGSGHGFKHGPAVGEYVRDRLLGRVPAQPRFLLESRQTARDRSVF